MKRIAILFAMAAFVCGFACVISSCEQKEEFEEPSQEVVFTASTAYDNVAETRTEYSGFILSGQTKERINWKAGDQISIRNTSTSQNAVTYNIEASSIDPAPNTTSNSIKSTAQITAASEKLLWSADNSANTFLAVYPATAMQSNTIGATIPDDQSTQTETHPGTNNGGTYTNPVMSSYAFMVAKASDQTHGEPVTLMFDPAMTAFEFNVAFANDGGNAPTINSFEMISTSTALTGAWSWDGATKTFSCPTFEANSNDKITVTWTGGRQVTAANPLKFTVFALPQNIRDVKIVFNLSGGKTKTLTLTGKEFQACKKYRITTPGLPGDEVWTYVIEPIANITTYGHNTESGLPFTIKSYKYKNGDQSTKVDVPWSATVTAATGTEATTSNLTITDPTGTGSGAGVANSANITEPSTAAIDGGGTPGEAAAAKMATNPVKGTESSRYDLSLYDIHGVAHNQETANCYVINSPGYYKFPLVYGNARKNGQDNTVAWAPSAATNSNTYLTPFLRSDNEAITGPYILDNMSLSASDVEAAIVWQDVPEESLILQENTTDVTAYGIENSGHGYIWFNINKSDIKQGNVVIAVRKKSDHSILWSWHLWFTEKDLHSVPTKAHSAHPGIVTNFMPYNLGWTDRSNASTKAFPTRTWRVRVAHTDVNSDASPVTFTVKQIGEVERIGANIGTCTFYEFGRKDPELPFKDENTNKEYTAGFTGSGTSRYPVAATSNTLVVETPANSHMNVSKGIQNPNAHSYTSDTDCWIGNNNGNTPMNLWSANITANVEDRPTIKTVYDPCPPGFCVPRLYSFSNFAQRTTAPDNNTYPINGTIVTGEYGVDFPTGYGNGKIFFPATGSRAHNDAGPQYVDRWGNYWTAAAVQNWGGQQRWGKTMNFQFYEYNDGTGWTSNRVINVMFERWKSCAYTVRAAEEE